jgi:hypothetical protein
MDSKFAGEKNWAFFGASDVINNIPRQLRHAVLFAGLGFSRAIASAFLGCVGHIVGVGSKK